MHPFEEDQHECQCPVLEERSPPTILFSILSRKHYGNGSMTTAADIRRQYSLSHHNCHCDQRRTVCLKDPEGVCQAASTVLVKTIRFMSSLPSFRHLPQRDQLALLYHSWVPLFVLGLAQEHTEFEVTASPANSILKRILLNTSDRGREMEEPTAMPTLANVHKIKACLHRLWNLDLSPKEYAYIKGALLFNPDVPGLQAPEFIKSLQQEAHRALHEVIVTLHPQDQGRLLRILLTFSSLQTIPHSFVSELFFRPVVGQADLFQLMREILSSGTVTRSTAAEREWSKHCQQ